MIFAEICNSNLVNSLFVMTLLKYIITLSIFGAKVLKEGERKYNYPCSGDKEYLLIVVSKVFLADFCYENYCPEGRR